MAVYYYEIANSTELPLSLSDMDIMKKKKKKVSFSFSFLLSFGFDERFISENKRQKKKKVGTIQEDIFWHCSTLYVCSSRQLEKRARLGSGCTNAARILVSMHVRMGMHASSCTRK